MQTLKKILDSLTVPLSFRPRNQAHLTLSSWASDQVISVKIATSGGFLVHRELAGTFIGSTAYFV